MLKLKKPQITNSCQRNKRDIIAKQNPNHQWYGGKVEKMQHKRFSTKYVALIMQAQRPLIV